METLALASDYSGVDLKEAVKKHLQNRGFSLRDVGQQAGGEKTPFYTAVANLAREIREGRCRRGIVFCGTGGGVSIFANKHRGIYCVACESVYSAKHASVINGANVLAMGGNIVAAPNACAMADAWLDNPYLSGFDEERRQWLHMNNETMQRMEKELFDGAL